MRKGSLKNSRVNEEVLRALSDIIRNDIKDPRISIMTSVVKVSVAPDLKTAKAYISVLGSEKEKENTFKGLKSAEGFVRSALAKKVNLRSTPVITFVEDDSIEYGVRMSHLIDELNGRNEDKGEADDEA